MRDASTVDYAAVFDATPAPCLLLDPDLVILDANAAYAAATGRSREELVGRPVFEAFPDNPEDPLADGVRNLRASLLRVRELGVPDTMAAQRYDVPTPDGGFVERYWSPVNVPVLDSTGRVAGLLHRVVDVTAYLRTRGELEALRGDARSRERRLDEAESDLFARTQELHESNRQLRLARDEFATRALHDPLTGLLVRPVLLEQLTQALARLRRHSGCVAVLFVDLDRFKQVNDDHGHAAGDALLRCIADRLREEIRPSDVVARIGGDEFVVMLDGLDEGGGPAEAQAVAQRILDVLQEPCSAVGVVLHPAASVGIALARSSDGLLGADELLSRADAAMYQAKRGGRGRTQLFDHAAHEAVLERRLIEQDLRVAAAQRRLLLHYQPIVDVRTGEIHAVEALLRWQHPDGRLRTAGEFIDVAEETGLLPEFGGWVIEQGCRQLAAWDGALGPRSPRRLFLNVSPGELGRPGLHGHLARSADAAGVEPGRLVVEVTETGLLGNATTDTLDGLQRLGCELAIDDFGTGYSSLSRLVELPVEILKIDRSFVEQLPADKGATAVIAGVLALADNLGKTVIAEGVEDAASLALLRDLGCTYAQGFHLGTPGGADEISERLSDGPC